PFRAQGLFQINQVFFPYRIPGEGRPKLAGLMLEQFASLKERVEIGKQLYAVLFGIPEVRAGAAAFAEAVRHTGSRADYWPELFTSVRERPEEAEFAERLDKGAL